MIRRDRERKRRRKQKSLLDFSRGFLSGSFNWVRHKVYPPAGERGRMGVGVSARLQHTPGIRRWDLRTENWVPICASNMGPESETNQSLLLSSLCYTWFPPVSVAVREACVLAVIEEALTSRPQTDI